MPNTDCSFREIAGGSQTLSLEPVGRGESQGGSVPAEGGPHGGTLELCLSMRFLPAEHVVLDTLWLPTTLKECDPLL